MFDKLLSLLPYNPSLVHQLSFYGKRMREEAVIRRTGLVFVVLAFLVQFFVVIAPPVATVADPSNDMIDGGFTSQGEAVNDCNNDVKNYRDVLTDFGISCNDVARASIVDPLSSTSTFGGQPLYSMGWVSQGAVNVNTGKATDQIEFDTLSNVPYPIYARLLSSFDSYSHSDYEALSLTSSVTGKHYFILFGCGNLVAIGQPVPVPPKVVTPPPAVCPLDHAILASNPLCKACPYDTSILKSSTNPKCSECPNPNHPGILASNPKCVPVCPYQSNLDKGNPACKPCTAAVNSIDAQACAVPHKTATNVTEGISNADGTTAQPGDVILYTLYAQNQGKATINQYQFEENISDVLDYATITDYHGATIDSRGELTWPLVNIKPGATATEEVTVKVDDPVPQTPADPADPDGFNLVMTNTFGNTINIKVPGTPLKTIVETAAATSLPNTGPGSSLFVGAAVVMVAGYFFFRSRLLAKEAKLALSDIGDNGGGL